MTQEKLKEFSKTFDPEKLAQELVSVQPMNPNLIADLRNDPLANQLLNNFAFRLRREYKSNMPE